MDNLTKMFKNLTPPPDQEPNKKDEAIQAIKEALLLKGMNDEAIQNLLSQL